MKLSSSMNFFCCTADESSLCQQSMYTNYPQDICIRYTMPTRGVSRIHEAITINPEGVARGINGYC